MNRRFVVTLSALGCSLFALAVMTAGCSLKKQSPAKLRYLVEAQRPGGPAVANAQGMLRVRNLQIASPFEGRGFVYRNSDQKYETDFYHEFLVTPQAILTAQVRQWLGASGLFRAVLDPAGKLESTCSLEGNVTALYGDFRDPAKSKAVLEIHFVLLREQGSSPQIALQKYYRQEAQSDERSADALAKAWGAALSKILAELERDLGDVRGR